MNHSYFRIEPEDENAADQAAVDKMVNACVTLIAVSLKSADEKANEIRAMAEKYERMARDAARTARQYSQAAEEVRKSAKKIQDKEAERQLLEKMRLDVDLTDDLETLQTRMKFTLETIEVVFGNMSVEEREEGKCRFCTCQPMRLSTQISFTLIRFVLHFSM